MNPLNEVKDYRSVSISAVLSKIYEMIVLEKYMRKINIQSILI